MKNKIPTVCWNAIVKNESAVIRRCMEALVDHIDYWVVVDTGSSDGTQSIIRAFMESRGIQGELHEIAWKNFGYNRSRAIELAEGKADYLLFCDADMLLQVRDPDWKSSLTADSYYVAQYTRTEFGYQNLRLVNARLQGGSRWRYWGATHEYCDTINAQKGSQGTLTAISFKDYADGGAKADKYARDIQLLEQQLQELEALNHASELELKQAESSGLLTHKDTLLPRTLFYLAQSYRDSDQYQKAIKIYRARAEAGGWAEEIWFSLFQIGVLLDRMDRAPAEVTHALTEAWEFRSQRAEPLWYLAGYYRINNQPQRAYLFATAAEAIAETDDVLFIQGYVYLWAALDELAMAAYETGRYQESADCNRRLLHEAYLPDTEVPRIEENLKLAEAKLQSYTDIQAA